MWNTLLWIYVANAALLIAHEIDSAYWQEWKLLRLPGGPGGFVLIHLPLLAAILYGLILVTRQAPAGLALSLLLGLGGLLAFSLHNVLILRGGSEFKTPVSLGVLWATLFVSVAQIVVALLAIRSAT